MPGQVLYRKYRPATFDDVLGQEHVVRALRGAIEQGAIGHAYLFSGSRGTGKTSLARIFARSIGTADRDLHEIDAASNRGVDDIRILREEVHALPFASPYKVYLIDEVHMLTKEAFNALLKTLEEPPQHVVFILATTEYNKLPDTIISRCQSFSFERPTHDTLRAMVERVAGAEGATIERAAADLVALLADGSFRDAHGILQQVLAAATDHAVSAELVEQVTGAPQRAALLDLLDALAEQNADHALGELHRIAVRTPDARAISTTFLRLLRAVLLARAAPSEHPLLRTELSDAVWQRVSHHAARSRALTSRCLMYFLDAHQRIGTTDIPLLPLELAIIEHCAAPSTNAAS